MRLAIMQPYFLPYIGYFQLIAAVDKFVVYDNIKYTKKGWINRNRMLVNGADTTFTLPLKNSSDNSTIVEREISAEFNSKRLLNQFKAAYACAPHFDNTYALMEKIVSCQEKNLFKYIHHSILVVCQHLNILTEIQISSEVGINHSLKGKDKVLALCKAVGAKNYINPIGGTELYAKDDFEKNGVRLQFIRSRPLEYMQLGAPFVPWLSIIDVLMFLPLDAVRACIYDNYELV